MMRRVLLPFLLLFSSILQASDPEVMLMLTDYVSVDYPQAVSDGLVINEFEYAEMQEFAAEIRHITATLPGQPALPSIQSLATVLEKAIHARESAQRIRELSSEIRRLLLDSYDIASHPQQAPDPTLGEHLYQQHCAACHGAMGNGQGEFTAGMNPPPTDFTDVARALQRSPYGLFATISRGVKSTAMQPFESLDEHQRWSLAYYTGALHVSDATLENGKSTFDQNSSLFVLNALNTQSLAEIASTQGTAMANAYAWLRKNPDEIFNSSANDPLTIAISNLERSAFAYRSGQVDVAHRHAVDAYLEGFELIETALANIDSELVLQIETRMMQLRRAIRKTAPQNEVNDLVATTIQDLQKVQSLLNEQAISPSVAFSSAIVILLREGLEAILILAAIAAFLIKTGRKDGLWYLHLGWISALLLGILTWIFSSYVIAISGATRELTEGITAIFAAGVLFYVGFWMHNKLSAQRWAKFIQEKISAALDKQTLLGITLISFIAVYREVFETVLFYQALWNQSGEQAQNLIISGFVTAAFMLVAATWLIFRAGARLPLRQFFAASALIMFALAIIFAGKGIAAMIEAGIIAGFPVTFARIDILGIYPELVGLGVQMTMAIAASLLVIRQQRRSHT